MQYQRHPYNLIIPCGVIFSDTTHGEYTTSTDSTQSVFVIAPQSIHFDAYDTLGICLKTFCLNLHHGMPYGNKYMFTVVSDNEQFYRMTSILHTKTSIEEHVGDIQSYIWQVTDGPGLTQVDYDVMNSWP